jgi:hypothetical protein
MPTAILIKLPTGVKITTDRVGEEISEIEETIEPQAMIMAIIRSTILKIRYDCI